MLSNKLTLKQIITIDDFLELFDRNSISNHQEILNLDFPLNLERQTQRICPIIHLAKIEDAKVITEIFKDVYKGTYPYKQMESVKEVEKMILDSRYHWFIFKINSNETVGCFASYLEFEKKRGLLFGFAIKRAYHKIIDIFKAFIGCILYSWKTYKNKIFVWYAEVRTKEKIPPLITSSCGLKPIAFLPNKDIFLNQIESDFLHIIYDEKALLEYRYNKKPHIIRQVLGCYMYSNERFHLGNPKVENPSNNQNKTKVSKLKVKIIKKTEKDKFDNKIITLLLPDSSSFFKFLYNPLIQSIEKTTYKIEKIEELISFIQEIKEIIRNLKIRYFECYVSAYNPLHQKVFFDAGIIPRGYVFSWEYNIKKKCFEDRIVFNYVEGDINKNLKLIPETATLLQNLK
ncbi:MAG: hypothetical protein ACFE9T_03330 [Promethearchaeota archaeon]